jgi:type II secretory pathway pseudopilin PulG
MFINPPPHAKSKTLRSVAAFTLIEVVIGLTILAMITGTLFAIIRGAVSGAADIERLQRENDSINRFVELCRITFQTMPSTGTLTLEIVERTDPLLQELTISGAPHCFSFGTSATSYKDTILSIRPENTVSSAPPPTEGVRYNLSLSREDLIPQTDDNELAVRQDANSPTAADDEGRFWMPLLPGVSSLTWRFYKQSEDVWEEEWKSAKWPDLIEMNLTMEGRTLPLRAVFSVPVISLRAGTQRSSGSNTPTPPTSTTTNSGGGRR